MSKQKRLKRGEVLRRPSSKRSVARLGGGSAANLADNFWPLSQRVKIYGARADSAGAAPAALWLDGVSGNAAHVSARIRGPSPFVRLPLRDIRDVQLQRCRSEGCEDRPRRSRLTPQLTVTDRLQNHASTPGPFVTRVRFALHIPLRFLRCCACGRSHVTAPLPSLRVLCLQQLVLARTTCPEPSQLPGSEKVRENHASINIK